MKKWTLANTSVGLLAVSVLLAGCATGPTYEQDKEYKLTILHTNDHHGRFWQSSRGEYGMAARKTLIDNIRMEVESEGGAVMLLSGGDINTGVPESDLQDAEPDFKGMNMLEYDAMALGNHEFDNPREVLLQQAEWAGFPFLSANIYKGNSTLFPAYEMFEVQGNRVAVVGFTTADTVKIGNPEYMSDLTFKTPVEVAEKLIPKLNKKADLVVAVTHMGHYADGKSGGNAPGDVTLARSVSGIDVIVGGHSQNPLFEPDVQNGTLILQAHEWGKYVGRLDLTVKNGEITNYDYRLIPVNLKDRVKDAEGNSTYVLKEAEIAQDLEMLAMLSPYQKIGAEKLNVVIGSSNGDFIGDRAVVRNQPTNLGVLVARAQKEKAKADLAVMNSGGIRADLEGGEITYKDVLTVQPFGNILSYVDLTGAELLDYLAVAMSKEAGSGAFAQFDGVEIMSTDGVINAAYIDDRPIDMDKMYRLAINSYMASGGDGYPKMSDHPNYVNTGFVDADVMVEFIENNSPLDIADFDPGYTIDRM
ncbi:bifunctional UDP-sugar hydrolase/5'-nucleotidase UshA [Reinekea marina]|uniref:Bifunctional UDP-sugar hydrolase/5'-nucleotidase UshA n=1 Tax=Reinekea marina TaxID=1310421 RepID=A0ABV7WVM1_9GAMM|nr:bifunctional UDP-sugar hydrolase/5'-nucleotidase UshA [Reinekea marina]MDN3648847.1 bifunctional UDP-sugar hydrolase/5'-nucleotidase UshA [Reinekea marina]